jgi:N-acetylglucosamine-6-phosphate deacetylase
MKFLFKHIFKSDDDDNGDHDHKKHMLIKLTNCQLLRNDSLIGDDLWIRSGLILDPETIFFDEKKRADLTIDCEGAIIAPGLIDLQINGINGKDFTYDCKDIKKNLESASHDLLKYGVTAFCPTIVSSEASVYANVLPNITKPNFDHDNKVHSKEKRGATILGAHLEGPFIR